MPLDSQIEALLFSQAEPLSVKKIAELLSISTETASEGLQELKNNLAGRGITLLENDGEVMLGTAKEASELIEKIRKEELSRDLGKAALETLSVILYRGPISRPGIDYIRGVNSSFILRNLLIRGLIDRAPDPNDARTYLYKPTFDLLGYLGVSSVQDLPEYEAVKDKLEKFAEIAPAEDNEEPRAG